MLLSCAVTREISPSRVAGLADDSAWADEEVRTVVGMEEFIAEDVIADLFVVCAVALMADVVTSGTYAPS